MTNFQPSARAQVIARRTYNRPLNEDGTLFETWEQTIDRVCLHQRWLWERALGDKPLDSAQNAELAALRELLLERKVSVSGRTLWLGGTDIARKREASNFNCSFATVETVYDVVDCMWLLLQGCGVGFKPVPGNLSGFTKPVEIEVIRSQRHLLVAQKGREKNEESIRDGVWHLTIGDSAESWAKAVGKIIVQKRPLDKIILDFSQIRPAGYRLKGYGWISSGDETFCRALEAICQLLNRKTGQLLNAIDILDIMNWLGTTLSSRRSAEIAVLDYGHTQWKEFATAKKDHWIDNPQRSQSNNSLLFYRKPTKREIHDLFEMMMDAGGSEPGFINAEHALKRGPWFKGCNPCLVGSTRVAVRGLGLVRIADLVDAVVPVWDGTDWVDAPFKKTGENQPIIKIGLSNGSYLEVTPTHNLILVDGTRCSANSIKIGDSLQPASFNVEVFGSNHNPEQAYRDAWMIADGTWYGSMLYLYEPKHKYKDSLEKTGLKFQDADGSNRLGARLPTTPCPDKAHVPSYVFRSDIETIKAFILGSVESDGHLGYSKNGWIVQFNSIHRTFLEDVQLLLKMLDVKSKISLSHKEGYRSMPDGKGGYANFYCQASYRITVSNAVKFLELFYPEKVVHGSYNKPEIITVTSIEMEDELQDVYCCGVETTGTFDLGLVHSGNCAEILLGNGGFCNLCETDLAKFNGDWDGLLRAFNLIARANYRQTCVNLDDGILQRKWHELNEFLRLTGVGVTGIVGWEYQHDAHKWVNLKICAQSAVNSMADELGMPRSKAVTTIKPSGTLSKVMDTTEGLHRPLGQYIFNNVRFSNHDPIVKKMRAAGYRTFADPYSSDCTLITFPVNWDNVEFDLDENGKKVNHETAISQLERYKMVMDNYVDHNASVTISYSPDEATDVADWVFKNWDHYVGVSFLYRNDPSKTAQDLGYPYLPQEVVDEDTFTSYTSGLKPFDLDGKLTKAEKTVDQLDLEVDAGNECAGGVCPIR